MSQEFFPKESWLEIKAFLLDDCGLLDSIKELELQEADLNKFAKEINGLIQKISSTVQSNSKWEAVREPISWQHKVEIQLTPNGSKKSVSFETEMSLNSTGLEEKVIGKSTQTVPFKVSFNVKKLNSSHPLYFNSGRNFVGIAAIKKVMGPPFKTSTIKTNDSLEGFARNLLYFLRTIPFSLAKDFLDEIGNHNLEGQLKKTAILIKGFLQNHSRANETISNKVNDKMMQLGDPHDPEMTLAFYDNLYNCFNDSQNEFDPHPYIDNIKELFSQKFTITLKDILKQMIRQQNQIHKNLGDFGEIESEKQRFLALKKEYDAQKGKGLGDEVLRRSKADLAKITKRITNIFRKFESSKGIILVQELYLNALEKTPYLQHAFETHGREVEELKTSIQANHLSASKDLEKLSKKLGKHSQHLLIQHAIYSEIEPDLSKVVSIDQLTQFDMQSIAPILNLVPSIKSKVDENNLNSKSVLKATLEANIPESEKIAFQDYLEHHPDPDNTDVSRFTQQLDGYINIASAGSGLAPIIKFLAQEMTTIKAVVSFAATQNKCNTDFKNHLKYYSKVFLEPYLDIIEEANHENFEEIERAFVRLQNSIKVQMDIKYTYADEKALLAMFKHINGQLQNENLFSTKVFSKQIKQFINLLTKHKKTISTELMKKVLETYTVFMMGCSRTKQLSRESKSVDQTDITRIKQESSNLTAKT